MTTISASELSPQPQVMPPNGPVPNSELSKVVSPNVAGQAPVPSVRDIDSAFDEAELSDEETEALETQRAEKTARPTVPLVRYNRS